MQNDGEYPPFPMLVGFQSEKAAQIAAYFAVLSGGQIEKLKLIKLMYLADREKMRQYDRPMFYDQHFSLKHGPICSTTLDAINGKVDQKNWNKYVAHNGNVVTPLRRLSRDDMGEVSDAEYRIVEGLWKQFKDYTASQIRNWTHTNCPEYTEVERGSIPIQYQDIFTALKKSNAQDLAEKVAEHRRFEAMFN